LTTGQRTPRLNHHHYLLYGQEMEKYGKVHRWTRRALAICLRDCWRSTIPVIANI